MSKLVLTTTTSARNLGQRLAGCAATQRLVDGPERHRRAERLAGSLVV
jgi:hypothetical protein